MTSDDYFSDRERGPRARDVEDITLGAWGGIVALLRSLMTKGAFGESFPLECSDGAAVIGSNDRDLALALAGEVDGLPWPLDHEQPPLLLVALDLVEFAYRNVSKPIVRDHHAYLSHDHLRFEREEGQSSRGRMPISSASTPRRANVGSSKPRVSRRQWVSIFARGSASSFNAFASRRRTTAWLFPTSRSSAASARWFLAGFASCWVSTGCWSMPTATCTSSARPSRLSRPMHREGRRDRGFGDLTGGPSDHCRARSPRSQRSRRWRGIRPRLSGASLSQFAGNVDETEGTTITRPEPDLDMILRPSVLALHAELEGRVAAHANRLTSFVQRQLFGGRP